MNLNAGLQTDIILLDLAKAFDKVFYKRHSSIIAYGEYPQFDPRLVTNRTQQVVLNGHCNHPANVS